MPKVDYNTLPSDLHERIEEDRAIRHQNWKKKEIEVLEEEILYAQRLANADFRKEYHERTKYNSIKRELNRINQELDPYLPLPLAATLYFYNNPLE